MITQLLERSLNFTSTPTTHCHDEDLTHKNNFTCVVVVVIVMMSPLLLLLLLLLSLSSSSSATFHGLGFCLLRLGNNCEKWRQNVGKVSRNGDSNRRMAAT